MGIYHLNFKKERDEKGRKKDNSKSVNSVFVPRNQYIVIDREANAESQKISIERAAALQTVLQVLASVTASRCREDKDLMSKLAKLGGGLCAALECI